jgi:hypothetical protein
MISDNKNSIVSKEKAESVLQPHFDSLLDIVNGAWRDWEELGTLAPHLRAPLSNHCRARFVYDHIVRRAKLAFEGKPGIRLEEKRGFLLIHIQNILTIRFKKLDSKLRASNIQTRQQILFSLQMDIPGLPRSTRLVTGYRLDELQIAIEQIAVTCPNGNKLEYVIEIPDSGSNVIALPGSGPTQPIKPAEVFIINKEIKAKENDKDGK